MIHEPAILAVTGELDVGSTQQSGILKSPGQLPKHYAPKARLMLLSWHDDADLQRQLGPAIHHPSSTIHVVAHTRIPGTPGFARISVIPHDPEAFARAIYAELHQCDEAGAELII